MTKLTDGQRAMLMNAASRNDGAVTRGANKAGAAKIAASLIAQKLLRECKGKAGQPVWRKDEGGKSISLILTRAGRIAVEKLADQAPDHKPSASACAQEPERRASIEPRCKEPRAGSKQALLVEMLSKGQGATLDDMIAATGWLPHTTRAALTGLRERGLPIERTPAGEGASSAYRIVATKAATA